MMPLSIELTINTLGLSGCRHPGLYVLVSCCWFVLLVLLMLALLMAVDFGIVVLPLLEPSGILLQRVPWDTTSSLSPVTLCQLYYSKHTVV